MRILVLERMIACRRASEERNIVAAASVILRRVYSEELKETEKETCRKPDVDKSLNCKQDDMSWVGAVVRINASDSKLDPDVARKVYGVLGIVESQILDDQLIQQKVRKQL